jgi:hypothetical protein
MPVVDDSDGWLTMEQKPKEENCYPLSTVCMTVRIKGKVPSYLREMSTVASIKHE